MAALLVSGDATLPGDLDLRPAAPGEAGALLDMTFPAYRRLLDLRPQALHAEDGDHRLMRPLAVAAWQGETPAGLAIAALPEGEPVAEALSLFVAPRLRQRGLGGALLAALEQRAAAAGARRLGAVYMTSNRSLAALEALAARRGWQGPVPRMLVVKFTVDEAKTVRWYGTYRLRAELEFFPWAEVGAAELASLRESQERDPWIPPDLVPWKHDPARLEATSSIGARLDGRIVGWVINHRLGGDLVRFTTAFIRRDLARRGRLVPLFSEAIRRLDGTPFRRCTFTTPLHHREMVTFVRRHCERWVSFVGETRETWTDLTPEPSAIER